MCLYLDDDLLKKLEAELKVVKRMGGGGGDGAEGLEPNALQAVYLTIDELRNDTHDKHSDSTKRIE
jgi:hypothetical protein